jgi:hypothetical protein
MQIQFPTNFATPLVARLTAALPWSVNEIVVAEVVGKTEQNFTRLAIGDRIVMARTDAMLEVGQKLNLKVTATGDTTVMKVLPTNAQPETSTVSSALARVLPQQATPQDTERLLRSLDALAQDAHVLTDSVGRTAAATLTQDIRNVLKALPTAAQVSDPPQLRNAVEQAAQPTEARIMNAVQNDAAPDVGQDVRAQFARLATDLAALPAAARGELDKLVQHVLHGPDSATTAPPAVQVDTTSSAPASPSGEHHITDIKTLAESVVARLESNQLQSVASAPANQVPLLIDLPVARDGHTDLLHMEVESDGRQVDGEVPKRTSVTLNLKLDGGHEFSARLQLSEDVLSVRLGSTDARFNDQIVARIADLEHGLKDAGLEVNQIFIAPLTVSPRPRLGARQLINERV